MALFIIVILALLSIFSSTESSDMDATSPFIPPIVITLFPTFSLLSISFFCFLFLLPLEGEGFQSGRSNNRTSAGSAPRPETVKAPLSSTNPSASPAPSSRPATEASPLATCSQ